MASSLPVGVRPAQRVGLTQVSSPSGRARCNSCSSQPPRVPSCFQNIRLLRKRGTNSAAPAIHGSDSTVHTIYGSDPPGLRVDGHDLGRRVLLSGLFLLSPAVLPHHALAKIKVPSQRRLTPEEAREIGDARREELEKEKGELVRLPYGVAYRERATGTGALAERGSTVSVSYQIFQQNGNYVDSVGYGLDKKDDVGDIFQFKLGYGQVPLAIELAMEGMRVGGKRRISVPPGELGWILQDKQDCPKIVREGLGFEVISRECLKQPIPESSSALRRFSRPALQNALLFEVELMRVK